MGILKKNLEGATVKLLTRDKTLTFFVTDKNGEVDLSHLINNQVYSLEINCIGYKTKTLFPAKKELSSVVKLEKDYKVLEEVLIKSSYRTRKVICKIECISQMLRCTVKGVPIQKEDSNQLQKTITAFDLFPNPVYKNSSVTVRLKQQFEGQIQLVNSTGQIVQSFKADDKKNIVSIPLNNLSAGVYFVRLINHNSNQLHTQKLIIQ